MKNTIFRFGFYAGILLVGLSWLNYVLLGSSSYNASQIGGYISIILALTLVYFGIRFYRDRQNDGHISFGKAFRMGVIMTLIPGAFMFFNAIIFFSLLGDKWMEWALENMPPEQAEQYAQAPDWMMHPAFQGVIMFATVFVLGIIISLISALMLNRQP